MVLDVDEVDDGLDEYTWEVPGALFCPMRASAFDSCKGEMVIGSDSCILVQLLTQQPLMCQHLQKLGSTM